MKKYLLLTSVLLFAFKASELPEGWIRVEETQINGEKVEVYFFDYMSKLDKLQPEYSNQKGNELIKTLQKVQFQFPAYVAKKNVAKEDSVIYYILRPNESKSESPFFFDLEIVKVSKDFPLQSLEDKAAYKERILKVTDAKGCRGALVCEHNKLIQNSPNKEKLIGSGIQITDSIFTRVIAYKEIKNTFYRLIESNP